MLSALTFTGNAFLKAISGSNKKGAKTSTGFYNTVFDILTRRERQRFVLLVLADIAVSVVDILSLALLLWVVQFYIEQESNNISALLPGWMLKKDSVFLMGLFLLVFVLKNLSAFFIVKAQYKFVGSVAVRLSKNALVNYQQAEFDQFTNVDSSVHVRKIAHQPFEFAQYVLSGIQQILTQSFLIIIAIFAIMWFNARLFFLLLVVLLPPVIAVFYFLKRKLSRYRTQIWSGNDTSFQYLMDALKGYIESNVYNRNNFFLTRFLHFRKKFSSYHFDSISLQTLPARVIEIFAVFGLFVLIVIAKWSGDYGAAQFLTIGAFMAAAYKIIPGIVKIINSLGQIKAYELSVIGLNRNLEQDEAERATIDPIRSVQFRNVSFDYGNLPVLKNLSFELTNGDFIGISGKSGRGKTTILNLLLGFLSPSDGEILINGNGVNKKSIRKFRPFIAYVGQQAFLIHDSIKTNITLQEHVADANSLRRSIQISGVGEIFNATEGANRMINENGKNISGGQQQRIMIARAVYNDADLILLDEPFNELDELSELVLLDHFKRMAENGKIIVLITHNRKSLAYCNKIISLDEQTG